MRRSERSEGSIIVDLTAPLSDRAPILRLPEPFGNTHRIRLEEIGEYVGTNSTHQCTG